MSEGLVSRVRRLVAGGLNDLVESIDVVVREEKIHGTTAYVTAEPAVGVDPATIRERIDAILGHYTVRYEVRST